MKTRFVIFLIACVLLSVSASAQKYVVYTVTGDVTKLIGKKIVKVSAKQTLEELVLLNIPSGSKLVLLDEANSKLCTIKVSGKGTIKDLLNKTGNTSKSISAQYLSYMLKRNQASPDKNTYMQTTAAAYRDVDSLFFNVTDSIPLLSKDSTNTNK